MSLFIIIRGMTVTLYTPVRKSAQRVSLHPAARQAFEVWSGLRGGWQAPGDAVGQAVMDGATCLVFTGFETLEATDANILIRDLEQSDVERLAWQEVVHLVRSLASTDPARRTGLSQLCMQAPPWVFAELGVAHADAERYLRRQLKLRKTVAEPTTVLNALLARKDKYR
ncbi:hypothetical protein [Pseudoruegeria sp. SK021]|uniref:hypothetical protein n=1 Tax=Pseudoruegeria sp. SK021 TaxID=1933035 RepID=UPI000A21F181|nr:hypothetical protein [Pseudoruegeria sp. SK021]OSP53537.1 hypothetical protein BV911_17455 [Pseudoruegeria sp. SK021]